jgi:hypothetical protein
MAELIFTGGKGDAGRGGGVTNFGDTGLLSFELFPNAILIASAAAADLLYPYMNEKMVVKKEDLIEEFLKFLLKELCLIIPRESGGRGGSRRGGGRQRHPE